MRSGVRQPRRLVWLVDSLDRLRGFPASVRERFGFALYRAQIGETAENVKPLHGFEVPVWEVRATDPSGTYRAAFVVHFSDAVYVLHAFQKKSTSGVSTPKQDIDLIRKRLSLAQASAGKGGC
jgi:phage-related protein